MKVFNKNIRTSLVIVTIALLLLVSLPQRVLSDSLTSASDTLETSLPSTDAIHTFVFRNPTALSGTGGGGNDEIRFAFEADFTFNSLANTDVTVETGGTGGTPSWASYTAGTIVVSSPNVTIPLGATDIAATTWIRVTIGDTNKVENPSGAVCGAGNDSNICTVAVTTTDGGGSPVYDSINMRVGIVSGVTITAQIDTTLSFAIAGGSCDSGTVTATSVDFASIIPGTAETCTQTLTISTNATGGYTTTTIADAQLTSGANDIDWFTGTNAAPTAWAAPVSITPNTNTGYLGYHTNDGVLGTGTTTRFSLADTYAAWSTSTAYEVAYNNGPVTAEATTITYQIEVNTSQPTGNYSGTTITYVSTPIF